MSLFNEVKKVLEMYDIASVAEHAEVSDQTLYNWLNGRVKSPYIGTLVRVADVLEIDIVAVTKRQTRSPRANA